MAGGRGGSKCESSIKPSLVFHSHRVFFCTLIWTRNCFGSCIIKINPVQCPCWLWLWSLLVVHLGRISSIYSVQVIFWQFKYVPHVWILKWVVYRSTSTPSQLKSSSILCISLNRTQGDKSEKIYISFKLLFQNSFSSFLLMVWFSIKQATWIIKSIWNQLEFRTLNLLVRAHRVRKSREQWIKI